MLWYGVASPGCRLSGQALHLAGQVSGSHFYHIFGLQAFFPGDHVVLDALAFNQDAVAFATDGAEMNKDVVSVIAGNEAKPFGGVEPLDGTGFALHIFFLVVVSEGAG